TKYEGEPLELAQEFLPLIFAATHPDDLEAYHDEDHNLQTVWDDFLEAEEGSPLQKATKGEIVEYTATKVPEWKAKRIHGRLLQLLGEDIHAGWFASMEFPSLSGGVLTVSVLVAFVKNWIQDHYADDLLQVCAEEFDGLERVDVVVRQG